MSREAHTIYISISYRVVRELLYSPRMTTRCCSPTNADDDAGSTSTSFVEVVGGFIDLSAS